MDHPTCTIDGCERPLHNLEHGWCKAHYLRWYRHGDPLHGRKMVAPHQPVPCSVDGCERISQTRGLCGAHYQRFLKVGDPGTAEVEVRRRGEDAVCSYDGCNRKYYGKGWCNKHYQRWVKFGDAGTVLPGAWRGDDVGYEAVHERMRRQLGPASAFRCAHCEGPATDWAYDGTCPDEKLGPRHGRMLTYSTDPDRYMPLCRVCHSAYDGNIPRRRSLRV
jgi:hypothetical protein